MSRAHTYPPPSSNKQFYIACNRECPRRSIDCQRLYRWLVANNWRFARNTRRADLIIICTCASTDYNENTSLFNIKAALKKKAPSARLVVTGCLTKVNPETIRDLGNFITIPPRQLDDFDKLLESGVSIADIPEEGIVVVPDFVREENFFINRATRFLSKARLSRAFIKSCIEHAKRASTREPQTPSYDIKVAEGCLGNCSYCCIRFATGRLQSKPLPQVVREFETGLRKGHRLFKLVGIDTGCYGLDMGTTVVPLLEQIFGFKDEFTLILSDFNPQWLLAYYDQLLPLFLRNSSRLKEISLPIQSGSDRLVRAMKRPYKIEDVRTKVRDLRKQVPGVRFITHVVVGFPGETAEDFDETKRLLEECLFDRVAVYEYNDRPNTESSKMEGKVRAETIEERARVLRDMMARRGSLA